MEKIPQSVQDDALFLLLPLVPKFVYIESEKRVVTFLRLEEDGVREDVGRAFPEKFLDLDGERLPLDVGNPFSLFGDGVLFGKVLKV